MDFSSLQNKSVLVTGGTGFFGQNLCEYLVQLNQNIKIFALARNEVSIPGVTFIKHDTTKPFEFNIEVDFIIHAATPVVQNDGKFEETMSIIVNGTQMVLDFAKKMNVKKVLLVSSGAAYGEDLQYQKPIKETDHLSGLFFNPKSAYGSGKRISELMGLEWARKNDQHLAIARCFAFSGKYLPLDNHLAIGNFVRMAMSEEKCIKILSDGSAVRSYLDAEDLCEWLLTILLKANSGEIYNVGSKHEISIKELAHKVASLIPGTKVEILGKPLETNFRNCYVPSTEKAETILGLKEKVTLEESIKKMIEFNKRKK